jgi:predicted nucleic acid-binding protein
LIEVVSDANVALKWFHGEGEEEVAAARALLAAQRERTIALAVLDLTTYELGNALLRGRLRIAGEKVAAVLEALSEVCPAISPTAEEMRDAVLLAAGHDLTVYDAAYAAVARRRGAQLVTLDGALLSAGLGRRPFQLMNEIGAV